MKDNLTHWPKVLASYSEFEASLQKKKEELEKIQEENLKGLFLSLPSPPSSRSLGGISYVRDPLCVLLFNLGFFLLSLLSLALPRALPRSLFLSHSRGDNTSVGESVQARSHSNNQTVAHPTIATHLVSRSSRFRSQTVKD